MIDEIERISKIKKERNNMSVKIGKARFGGQQQIQRRYFKLKDGEQAYRILPPIKELADSGRWSIFHSVHYGYKSTDEKFKPFISPEVKNRKTGMIEVPDAAKERIQSLKAKLDEAKASGNSAALEKLNFLVGQTGLYNLDNNHYMNVIDAQGNIGVLKLRHKAKLALEAEIKALNADGHDPLSVEDGRFFVFTRTGMGRDTTFGVKVLKEKIIVQGIGSVERDVVHALDDALLGRLEAEGSDLDKIFRRPTAEQVQKIVESSNLMTGITPYLDTLFGKNASAEQTATEEDAPDAEEPAPKASTVAPVKPLVAPVAAAVVAPVAAAVVAPVTPSVAPVKPKTSAASITEMSNDEFLERLNSGSL